MSHDIAIDRVITALPDQVFATFTDPAGQREFYGKDDSGWIVESTCDLRVGGLWSVTFGPSRHALYRHDHAFLAVDPPHRLLMTTTETRVDGSSFDATTEFTFAPHPRGTRMTLRQTGFPTQALRDEHTIGVPHAFDRLERALGLDPEGF